MTLESELVRTIEKPVMQFFQEHDCLRIEFYVGGVLQIRFLAKEDAELMMHNLGVKSTAHRGQLVTV
jgi:hypothetical protein